MRRVVYIAFKVDRETGKGEVFAATDKMALSARTGIGYSNLVRIFTRERLVYYCSKDGWEVVKSEDYEKGVVRNKLGARKG